MMDVGQDSDPVKGTQFTDKIGILTHGMHLTTDLVD